MRKILALIFLIATTLSYSQEFKERFSQDVCKCFTEKKEIERNTLESCYTKYLVNYQSDFNKLIDKDSKLSEYEQGVIHARKLFEDMQSGLIQNCDAYYEFFNSLREKSILEMRKNYPDSKLDSLNKEISVNKTAELLWERGNAHFTRNELSKAKKDYEMCLEINPNYIQSIYFLGWVYEKQKNYSKAIELYNRLFLVTQNVEFKFIIEIAKRKSKL
ncbi:MAG: tetratricopeptide repeat protein [Flavobacteriaceae bacterium]